MTAQATEERFVSRRRIPASAAAIFAVLADPARHQDTEPTDWVRTAIDPVPITAVGQVFGMNMFMERAGGHYVMHSRVTAFEPERCIAWAPGMRGADGVVRPGGWFWRYDLEPAHDGTDVTLTYDWSGTPQSVRDEIGTPPPFPPEFLDRSLEALERAADR